MSVVQVICWVLGEYGTLADIPVESVIDRMATILDTQTATDSVRGYLVTAFGKLCSQSGCRLTPQAEEVLHDAINSRNLDLQQHALEIQTLLRYAVHALSLSTSHCQADVRLPLCGLTVPDECCWNGVLCSCPLGYSRVPLAPLQAAFAAAQHCILQACPALCSATWQTQ